MKGRDASSDVSGCDQIGGIEMVGISTGAVVRIGASGGGFWDRSGYRCEDVPGGEGKMVGLVAALSVSSVMM